MQNFFEFLPQFSGSSHTLMSFKGKVMSCFAQTEGALLATSPFDPVQSVLLTEFTYFVQKLLADLQFELLHRAVPGIERSM